MIGLVGLLFITACRDPNEPDPIPGGSRRLSVGSTTACALDPAGLVYCWGGNSNYLEYGSAVVPASGTPVSVPVPKLTSFGGGWGQHKCGLVQSDAVCWGRGQSGQLGNGNLGAAGNPPATVAVMEKWVDISTGRLTTCALNSDAEAFCWGLNQSGEVGDTLLAQSARQLIPNRVVGGIKFSSVVAGWLHSCGISTAGVIYCWGNNTSGQLGLGVIDTAPHAIPGPIASLSKFRKVALSARASCAITDGDDLYCWGYNGVGVIGDGTTITRSAPTRIGAGNKWKDVAMGVGLVEGTVAVAPTGLSQGGIAHACAIDDGGSVYCWGWNGAGQLGDGTTISRLEPTAVLSSIKFDSIALGSVYSCGTSGSSIYCWGSNSFGQLGIGTTQDAYQPVKVLTSW